MMNNVSKYRYLVLYIKNNEKIFTTTRLSIPAFEKLLEQRVLKFWELDADTGVKNN